MGFEEDTYSSIFLALKHPVRRRILRILNESPATYTEILNGLGVETGFLNYHLDSLGPLIAKNENGLYSLSEFGKAALALITRVEAPIESIRRSKQKRLKVFGFKINPIYILAAIMIVGLTIGAAIGAFMPQVHQAYITQTNMILATETRMDTTTAAITQTKIETETVVLTETSRHVLTENPGHQSIHSPTVIDSPGTYVLSEDISDSSVATCIRIISSDVILDGQGHTIDGIDTHYATGVYVHNPSTTLTNVTVKNLTVTDWHYGICYRNTTRGCIANNHASSNQKGIHLHRCSNSAVTNNMADSNYDGISLRSSSNNTLVNNDAISNADGISLEDFSSHNILISNDASLNDASGIYVVRSKDNTFMNNTASSNYLSGILLDQSDNNTLTGNTVSSNEEGIWLFLSSNNTLMKNTANSNAWGLQVHEFSHCNRLIGNNASSNAGSGILLAWGSSSNMLMNNTCSNNYRGIDISGGATVYAGFGMTAELPTREHNLVINNTANHNKIGIRIKGSIDNTLASNTANSNQYGIWVVSSRNNTLTRNRACMNEELGISLFSSSGNMIYDNYFDNEDNVRDDGENTWNIVKTSGMNIVGGPFIGGNFWSDYTGRDSDGDGLGNDLLPYDSHGGIVYGGDLLPLLPID